jgi:DNA-binding IclR family transcriptional regulator
MSIHNNRNRISIIDHHIRTKARGNIDILAHKLELSRAGTYKFLEEMKEEGFPIAYSKKDNRFYYTVAGKMVGYDFVKDIDCLDSIENNSRVG